MPFGTRRRFIAGAAASTLASSVVPAQEGNDLESTAGRSRSERAFALRVLTARSQRATHIPEQQTNGDSERYPNHLANFSKALVHDDEGLVDPASYSQLLSALNSGQFSAFEAIRMGGKAKLVEPMAAFAYSLEGCDCHHTWMPPPPVFQSAEQASEMIELYWESLTRDTNFADYNGDPLINEAAADLSRLGPSSVPRANGTVTSQTIFRAAIPGCLAGPYLSQFLWLDIPVDNIVFPQRYPVLPPGADLMIDYAGWLSVQNGGVPTSTALNPARYILSARDLAAYVHRDVSCQSALNAALILSGFGAPAWSEANPYLRSNTQASFVAFGAPGLIDWVVRAANTALKSAWYQKWLVHRRIRPEEFGGRVQLQMTGTATYPISQRLYESPVLKRVFDGQGTYLLAQAYDEGCPVHPSYPAAHATIAGAAVTVLKALFNEDFVIPAPMIPSTTGDTLQPYTQEALTVGAELNKLAANIALGRDAAGVHWRSDSEEGLRLGERVATLLMRDLMAVTNDALYPIRFHNFDGEEVVITKD